MHIRNAVKRGEVLIINAPIHHVSTKKSPPNSKYRGLRNDYGKHGYA